MAGEPGYLIREATTIDAPALARLIRAAFEEYRGRLEPPSGAHAETADTLETLLDREVAYVAAAPGRTLLGCVFCDVKRDEFYLHRLAVLPQARGRGIGAALVAAVEKTARAAGRTWVTLNVRIALPHNRSYYERLGYSVAAYGAHKGYALPTFWTMRKRVGPPAARRVEVAPWNPSWVEHYARAAAAIARVYGDELLGIHHIGSTAVPGLSAKPIVDIMPVVRDIGRVNGFDVAMLDLGYQPLGENGIPGRRYFRKEGGGEPQEHVHLYAAGHPEIERHLAFCAYLDAHPAIAQEYGALKAALARQLPDDVNSYVAGKAAWVARTVERAVAWRRRHVADSPPR